MLIPYTLTIILAVTGLLLMSLLGWAAWRHRNPPEALNGDDPATSKEFGPQATNRWLRGLRAFFAVLIVTVFGFHSYWVFFADSNDGFRQAGRFDARNRRLSESALKGWVFDRSEKLENALVRYKSERGVITRDYPLGAAAVHLTGYSDFVFGAGGMEHAYRDHLMQPSSTYNRLVSPTPVGTDITVSLDARLQQEAFNLAKSTGKPTAIVALLLPNNEVLAMATAPSFDPQSVNDEATWRRLNESAENAQETSALVNRALGTLVTGGAAFYYRPGSTFKIFVAGAALDSGLTEERFTCRPEGFVAPGASRPIRCYGGEVHGTVGLDDAVRESCNQYFAQLGLKLGRDKLAEYAKRFGLVISPDDNRARAASLWQMLRGDANDFNFIFAPPIARLNLTASASGHDIALQAIGQGYNDMTVLQMALLASAAASEDGAFVPPTFEVKGERKPTPFISAAAASRLRELLRRVVKNGTAASAFARGARFINAAGKTGTADRIVAVYDREGNRVVSRIDEDGKKHYKFTDVVDSWFVGFAPFEHPKIAFAVIVEDGGQGAHAAAPLAAKLIERAAEMGYIDKTELLANRNQ